MNPLIVDAKDAVSPPNNNEGEISPAATIASYAPEISINVNKIPINRDKTPKYTTIEFNIVIIFFIVFILSYISNSFFILKITNPFYLFTIDIIR